MAATEITKKIYRPLAGPGKLYAAVYGSTALVPIGNALEVVTALEESVEKQDDMTTLGGGTHATLRRVTGMKLTAKLADLNVVNIARATRSTIEEQNAGTETDKPHTATLGSLIALPHVNVSSLVVKSGANLAAALPIAAANYQLKEGGNVWINEDAPDLLNGALLWLSYASGDQVVMEGLTAATPELYLHFVGLNELDSGKAYKMNFWRTSQSVAKTLQMVGKGFTTLDVECELIMDPTKDGVGESKYMQRIEQ